jgi:hypothetical protein
MPRSGNDDGGRRNQEDQRHEDAGRDLTSHVDLLPVNSKPGDATVDAGK